jgi:hypothetical protein
MWPSNQVAFGPATVWEITGHLKNSYGRVEQVDALVALLLLTKLGPTVPAKSGPTWIRFSSLVPWCAGIGRIWFSFPGCERDQ